MRRCTSPLRTSSGASAARLLPQHGWPTCTIGRTVTAVALPGRSGPVDDGVHGSAPSQ